jgi:glycine amidinotransferase
MQPRDSQLIIGTKFIATNNEIDAYGSVLDHDKIITPPDGITFDAPYVTVIGKDLIVDRRDKPWLDQYIRKEFPEHNIVAVDIGGHNDAVFAPVKPGIIISTYHHTNYDSTFPGWKVLHIKNQSWNAIPDWRKLKHSNAGKWWMPGEEKNTEFTNFVETWLTNWVGYVEETVFDVNLLAVNDRLVLVNNYNKTVFDFLKQHGVETIITPFRHRFFWDGGIHCITSDLYREGDAERYI